MICSIVIVFCLIFAVAKKASSPNELVSKLIEVGVSSNHKTQAFALEIFSRVEHKAAGPNVSFFFLLFVFVFADVMYKSAKRGIS